MTAAALFAAVEKVPREAWPEELRYFAPNAELAELIGAWFTTTGSVPVIVAHAELIFTASMLRWLSTGDKAVKILDLFTNRKGVHITLHYHSSGAVDAYHGDTLLEALAHACIAVKGAP